MRMEGSKRAKNATHSCSVAVCPSPNNVTYHVFPKDPKLQKKWIAACKRKDHINVRTGMVCGSHFEPDDYERDFVNELLNLPIRNRLKPGTIPTLNLLLPSLEKEILPHVKPQPVATPKSKSGLVPPRHAMFTSSTTKQVNPAKPVNPAEVPIVTTKTVTTEVRRSKRPRKTKNPGFEPRAVFAKPVEVSTINQKVVEPSMELPSVEEIYEMKLELAKLGQENNLLKRTVHRLQRQNQSLAEQQCLCKRFYTQKPNGLFYLNENSE